jgi:hypothetical protein
VQSKMLPTMVTDVDARRAHVDCSLGSELRAAREEHWARSSSILMNSELR